MTATSARLRDAGARVTPQRLLVADVLSSSRRTLTAQELYERVRERDPGLGRATVFRTLEALVGAGVARRLEQDGHVYGYVACRPGHHHHLACATCGRVEELDEAFVAPVAARVSKELGFEIDHSRVDFYGRCARCARRDVSPR